MTTLRFAPIVRVSTEQQEKRGESLATQKADILQYVESLKGTIPDACWQYSGQEHATPDQERSKLNKLLDDSGRGLFDAVICCDGSRWSRDNEKNKAGLKTLRANGIRFFIATMEYDLYNPEHCFFLGMSAEIGEYQTKLRNIKSINSRITRARRNVPTTGKLPYGRTWDEKNGWDVDPAQQAIIQQAARRYLDGESIPKIADTLGMNFSNLWKILTQRSGTEWECRFRYLNIDETVTFTIPRLLDQAVIEAIHERGRANKTYTHGEIKHRYLLSRMVFCTRCGYAMFGYTNHSGRRYYRHPHAKRLKECHCTRFVPAAELENSVLIHLVQTFGDVERIERAIKRATPDLQKIETLTREQAVLSRDLKKISVQKDKVVDAVAEGLLSNGEVRQKMDKLRERETSINNRLTIIESELNNIPDPSRVKRLTTLGMKVMKDVTKNRPEAIFRKSYEWRRKLIEHAFTGQDAHKQRLGVYVTETDDPEKPWQFEIRGTLETTLLALPLSDEYLIDVFKLDPEFQDVQGKLKEIRTNISSFVWGCTASVLP